MERRRRWREQVVEGTLLGLTTLSACVVVFIIGFVFRKSWPVLAANGLGLFITRPSAPAY
ncbi:MAG TPA: hypothetical protein GX513_13185 [Firmicutes bacterium]|nr:hypothetical protein [Bacillota bacterium]